MSIRCAAASKEKGGFILLVTLTVGSIARCWQGLCPDMKSKTHLCIQQVLVLYSLIGGWCGWCTSGWTVDWVLSPQIWAPIVKVILFCSHYTEHTLLECQTDLLAWMPNISLVCNSSWCHPIHHSLLWVAEWTWWWCYTCCQKLQSKVISCDHCPCNNAHP